MIGQPPPHSPQSKDVRDGEALLESQHKLALDIAHRVRIGQPLTEDQLAFVSDIAVKHTKAALDQDEEEVVKGGGPLVLTDTGKAILEKIVAIRNAEA